MAVGSDGLDRCHLPHVGAAESMTRSALAAENLLAAIGRVLPYRKGVRGRAQGQKKIGHALETGVEHGLGSRSNRHGRGVIALVDVVIVAVPMQIHSRS